MTKKTKEVLACPHCEHVVAASDDFCIECGSLFTDGLMCRNHPGVAAAGVCVICSCPFCEKCGKESVGRFLCNAHGAYEIYEGFARVFGTLDDTEAQFAKSCLEKAGMHPVLFAKRAPKGGPRFFTTLWAPLGGYIGHTVTEVKVMVPCHEVVKAEKTLHELKILKKDKKEV